MSPEPQNNEPQNNEYVPPPAPLRRHNPYMPAILGPPPLVRQVAGYYPLEGSAENPIDLTDDVVMVDRIAG